MSFQARLHANPPSGFISSVPKKTPTACVRTHTAWNPTPELFEKSFQARFFEKSFSDMGLVAVIPLQCEPLALISPRATGFRAVKGGIPMPLSESPYEEACGEARSPYGPRLTDGARRMSQAHAGTSGKSTGGRRRAFFVPITTVRSRNVLDCDGYHFSNISPMVSPDDISLLLPGTPSESWRPVPLRLNISLITDP